jgi:hypothetical protein
VTITFISDEKIAETSSKGNQEKWYDRTTDYWYKLDQFGYEALTETLVSTLLEKSNIEADTPFTFVRYRMEKISIRGMEQNACASLNFLKKSQSLITVNRLLTGHLGIPLKQKMMRLPSIKSRLKYLADATAEYTGLSEFPQYLTLMFEIDALFCNDDRHLNNIAVIKHETGYDYCPIFDNGAGLLSNTQIFQMNISPKALISVLYARPFNTTFNRQMNSARSLFGKQIKLPSLRTVEIHDVLQPLLPYYAQRDHGIIKNRITDCILTRQRAL